MWLHLYIIKYINICFSDYLKSIVSKKIPVLHAEFCEIFQPFLRNGKVTKIYCIIQTQWSLHMQLLCSDIKNSASWIFSIVILLSLLRKSLPMAREAIKVLRMCLVFIKKHSRSFFCLQNHRIFWVGGWFISINTKCLIFIFHFNATSFEYHHPYKFLPFT